MPPPNVIVFLTDQQRFDTLGLHGNPLDLTPNLDHAVRTDGTLVANSFTCQPLCGPARSCLQTGRYATATGCVTNAVPLPAGTRTLAHDFAESGYQTGYIGKWHLGRSPLLPPGETQSPMHPHKNAPEDPGRVPVDQRGGYDYWLASNILEFTSDAYDVTLYDGAGRPVRPPGYRVDVLADSAIRYVDAHRADPFFLFLSFIEPHHQNHRDDYPAPEGYAQRYEGRWMPPDLAALGGSSRKHLAGYCGQIKRLDEALGRLLDALRSRGMLDNTIVLFTADHGNHFRTRNGEYKRSCHEASIRVPTAFLGGPFRGGGRIDRLVSLIDLPPTLLDAAGVGVPQRMQGRSILPLLHEPDAPWDDEVFVQISESQTGRAVRTPRWKYGVTAPGAAGSEADAEHYVDQYLYDLGDDPYELRNLVNSTSHAEVLSEMRGRLHERMRAAGERECTISAADGP